MGWAGGLLVYMMSCPAFPSREHEARWDPDMASIMLIILTTDRRRALPIFLPSCHRRSQCEANTYANGTA
jgi:hypothetical protein